MTRLVAPSPFGPIRSATMIVAAVGGIEQVTVRGYCDLVEHLAPGPRWLRLWLIDVVLVLTHRRRW